MTNWIQNTFAGVLAANALLAASLAGASAYAVESDFAKTLEERVARLTPEQQTALSALLDQLTTGGVTKTTDRVATPQEAMRQAIRDFETDVANKTLSMDRGMAIFAKDFKHPALGGKDALRQLVESNWEMIKAGASDVKVSIEDAEYEIDGNEAEVYPVDIDTPFGSVTLTVFGKLEDGVWRVIGVDGV